MGSRRTKTSIQVYTQKGGGFHSKRLPLDATLATVKEWQLRLESHAVLGAPLPDEPQGSSFAEDARRYLVLPSVQAMPSYQDRAYHIGLWATAFKARVRASITGDDIAAQLARWKAQDQLSPSSLNRRRTALLHLFRTLDGRSGANPVADVPRLSERHSEQMRALPLVTLAKTIRHTPVRSQTRARLRIFLHTGLPHTLLMQVQPQDIDTTKLTLYVRARAKGRGMPAATIPISRRAACAFRDFARVNAWGRFSPSAMHSMVHRACDAANIPRWHPYQLRHSFGTWLAGRLKDDRVLMELMRTRSIARYTQGSVPDRLEQARTVLDHVNSMSARQKPKKQARTRQE